MSFLNLAKEKDKKNDLLFVGFNQDYGCFACGTEKGFIVYNCDPLKERFRRDFGAGIGIVEMLFRCNILALVGGGANPKFPPNKVIIWDDYQNKPIAELPFKQEVKAVKLRRDKIVVVIESKVCVFNFADLQLLHSYDTYPNPRGLCAISPGTSTVLAIPGSKAGVVQVELLDLKQSVSIQAHSNPLTQIVLNIEGNRLVTASEKGTLIRIFDSRTGERLNEFRRGADKAEIQSLVFSPSSNWVCLSSDKGTIHIYGIGVAQNDQTEKDAVAKRAEDPKARVSSLSFMKGVLPSYFSSQWSFAQFHLQEPRSIVCFGTEKDVIIAVCADGSCYTYSFDASKGGDCKQDTYAIFYKQV